MRNVPIVSVVGESGAGKTTFLEKLIKELKNRGLRVAVIKHHVHHADIDRPGKDTWRFAGAGADVVALSAPGKVGLFLNIDGEMELDRLAGMMGDVDIVLTEGYKRGNKPKIEVARSAFTKKLVSDPADLIALVSDALWPLNVPVFGLDDCAGAADFLIGRFGIGKQ